VPNESSNSCNCISKVRYMVNNAEHWLAVKLNRLVKICFTCSPTHDIDKIKLVIHTSHEFHFSDNMNDNQQNSLPLDTWYWHCYHILLVGKATETTPRFHECRHPIKTRLYIELLLSWYKACPITMVAVTSLRLLSKNHDKKYLYM